MRYLFAVLVVLALLALSACVDEPAPVEPTAVASASEMPAATATPLPTAEPATATATLPPPTETADAPSKLDPVTLSPVTREPATPEPTIPQLPLPGPIATTTDPPPTILPSTPSPTKPHLPLPGPPATATAEGNPPPEAPPEWTTYEDPDYGFTFRYPAERWTVLFQADDPNGLALVYHDMGIALRMRFKREGETADLQLYGGAAGELTAQGTIRFISKVVERTALVNQGITTRVFYNGTDPIPRGDMLFSFALVSSRDTPAVVLLPEDVQAEADRILESFELGTRGP